MLRELIPIARSDTEVLNTRRLMFGLSLTTPKNKAELSSAREEVPGAEKVPKLAPASSIAEMKPVKLVVSSTAICVPAPKTGCSKVKFPFN